MPNIQVQEIDDGVVLRVKGRFDFNVHNEFRDAYESALRRRSDSKFVIDLSDAEYLDSSALGMLLILRDRLGCDPNRQAIVNCSDQVLAILQMSNFDKLFSIQ